jgi:hypothetical protein
MLFASSAAKRTKLTIDDAECMPAIMITMHAAPMSILKGEFIFRYL